MCTGLCRRCYHQEYNHRKKTNPPVREGESREHGGREDLDESRDRSIKRQRRRSVGKGPFRTPDNVEIDTPYIVELSGDARSKCQVCKDRIVRDEMRVGVLRSKSQSSTSSSTTGGQCRWYHPGCFPTPPEFSVRRLHGRKKLSSEDRAELKRILSSPKRHKRRHRDRDRHSRSRSSSSSSELSGGALTAGVTKSKKKHKSTRDKKHKTHKKDGHSSHAPQQQAYQNDSSDSGSYSDVEDFDDEEEDEEDEEEDEEEEGEEESYDSEDSSQGSSHSDDGEF